jgi:hypothetical protein
MKFEKIIAFYTIISLTGCASKLKNSIKIRLPDNYQIFCRAVIFSSKGFSAGTKKDSLTKIVLSVMSKHLILIDGHNIFGLLKTY